ncbi:hypothetical protein AB0M50_15335 [Nonomuraea fuscirosea]|jgi:hypothetical protein|uniref:hypothetical protein n=1 Tax=Nonomuraea fuscirosea TaxID=1291556 RepID=UPI002DD8EF20|nr:hypothetical protein [Nonomuraea fuscirosea]WSA50754.1 hypothetical protein OIE67_42930 [Nonomuraea fuscirosea]
MTEPSGGSTDKPRRPVVVPAIALTAFTVVGITALLGGLSEAPDEPEPLSQGAVLDQGRYSTKFVGSRVTVEKGQFDWEEDKRFVELVFDVVNLGDDTSGIGMPPEKPESAVTSGDFAGSLIKISPAFPKDAGPFTFVRVKGGESRQLHPGVQSEVILRYRLKENEQPPEKITLDVGSFEYSADPVAALPYWSLASKEVGDRQMPEIKARVVLPVKKEGTT